MELVPPSLCNPAPLNTPSCGEEQWLYSWRWGGPPGVPLPCTSPFSTERANRWLSRVASGLCALSVIKGREKVYGLLVSVLPTDGMSSKHPPIPNLQGDVVEGGGGTGGSGVGGGCGCNLPLCTRQHPPQGLRWRFVSSPRSVCRAGRAIKEWVKFKLNIYDAICIMLLPKRLPRWIQIFFCRTLCGSLPSSKKCMQQMWTVLGNN